MKLIDPKGDTDLYCRLSREQLEKVGSVDLQERNLIKECKRLGLKPRAVHVDDGISASVAGKVRPGFIDLMAAIKGREIENIIAVDMDRFSRQNGEWAELLYRAGEAGVRIFARGQQIDASNPQDVLVATILGAVATTDSAIKGRKIRDAHEEIRRQGKFHGGRRPFGYEKDGVTPHAVEAPLYQELIRRVSRGESPHTVAADWKTRGIVGASDTPFDAPRLRYLVFSQRHAGQSVGKDKKVLGAAAWPGLVTPAQQARAVAAIKSRATVRAPRGENRIGLLTGLAFCAICGARLVQARKSQRHSRDLYRCASNGGASCGGVAVRMDLADPEVERRFLVCLTDPKVQRKLAKQQAAAPEVGGLLARRDQIDADLLMLTDMLSDGDIDRDDYRRQVRGLTAAKKTVDAELAASSLPMAITTDPETLIEKWSTLTIEERRANLAAVIERISVTKHIGPNRKVWNPDRILVDWLV